MPKKKQQKVDGAQLAHTSFEGVSMKFKLKKDKDSRWKQLNSVQSISFSKIIEYRLFGKIKYNIAGAIICTSSKESYILFFEDYPKYYAVQISFVDKSGIQNTIELYDFKLVNMGTGLSIDDTSSEVKFVFSAKCRYFL